MSGEPLLNVIDLKKYFPAPARSWFRSPGCVRAVDGVSFAVKRGETFGLVGESGCGKTTVGRTILRLLEPTAGRVEFEGRNVFDLPPAAMRRLRRRMQAIFQDPYSSLNPRMTVADIVGEPLAVYGVARGRRRDARVRQLLEIVGLSRQHLRRYPHEFSGGQRQRIGIARALALNPDLIVCDEPVSALDVSMQSQVINLLQDLQQQFGLTYLFIAHDLSVVRHISDRIGVMYLGKLVELAPTERLFSDPRHPYTEALLNSVPVPDPKVQRQRERIVLRGDVPSPVNPPTGCRFHTRCPVAEPICRETAPDFRDLGGGHLTACHLAPRASRAQVS